MTSLEQRRVEERLVEYEALARLGANIVGGGGEHVGHAFIVEPLDDYLGTSARVLAVFRCHDADTLVARALHQPRWVFVHDADLVTLREGDTLVWTPGRQYMRVVR